MAVEGREPELLRILDSVTGALCALQLPEAEELLAVVMAQRNGKAGKCRKRQSVGEPGLSAMPRPEERAGSAVHLPDDRQQ